MSWFVGSAILFSLLLVHIDDAEPPTPTEVTQQRPKLQGYPIDRWEKLRDAKSK